MKTEPQQEYRDLEKFGYLCRWAILTLVASAILIATLALAAGTLAAGSDIKTTVLLSDAVWRHGAKSIHICGFLDNRTPERETPLFLYQDHLGTHRFPWTRPDHKELVALFPAPPIRGHQVVVRGLPYGPMAFTQHQATLKIIPASMNVYVMDARLFAKIVRNDKRNNKLTAVSITKQFPRLGQLVLALPGQRKPLADLKSELDQYSDIPGVFSLRKKRRDAQGAIALITLILEFRDGVSRNKRKPYVITDDVEVAIAAADRGHYTHLVRAGDYPSNLPDLIRIHATAEKLAEHMANETPAHTSIP
jgi:hypothetical protein